MKIQEEWSYSDLPEEAQRHMGAMVAVSDQRAYKEAITLNGANKATDDLFALTETAEVDYAKAYNDNLTEISIIWGTDNYSERGEGYGFSDAVRDMEIIRPRTEKSLAEQKKRVKEKAEVFTPSWVCNLQNNLVDEAVLGENAFNVPSEDNKTWVSTPIVKFPKGYEWWQYVADRRLEMCCGEGPYLFSRYDTTTGAQIPVRTIAMRGKKAVSNWERIGILDRKLRVVTENSENLDDWRDAALIALKCTFGYEWQGDNLYLARMNMLNTFFDYYHDYVDNCAGGKGYSKEEVRDLSVQVAKIVSQQLWQMDGLKMVVPESCPGDCEACAKKKRLWHGGTKPVFAWGDGWRTFEEMYYLNGGK